MKKIEKGIIKYTEALINRIDEHIVAQIKIKELEHMLMQARKNEKRTGKMIQTKLSEWKVRLRSKGVDVGEIFSSIRFDIVKYPTVAKRRLQYYVLNEAKRWAELIKKGMKP